MAKMDAFKIKNHELPLKSMQARKLHKQLSLLGHSGMNCFTNNQVCLARVAQTSLTSLLHRSLQLSLSSNFHTRVPTLLHVHSCHHGYVLTKHTTLTISLPLRRIMANEVPIVILMANSSRKIVEVIINGWNAHDNRKNSMTIHEMRSVKTFIDPTLLALHSNLWGSARPWRFFYSGGGSVMLLCFTVARNVVQKRQS